MTVFHRLLKIDLPEKQSAFLWGARKTGKTTLLKTQFPDAKFYDFLKLDEYIKYGEEPYRLRQEIEDVNTSLTVIIDEVQKIPSILNEIHYLIESTPHRFILCGSSARKLKRYDVNMLGGRAWKFNLFPLTSAEIPDIDLKRVFSNGLIPSHYLSSHPRRFLKSYIEDYLTHEIQAEGLVRQLPRFSRFMDSLKFCHGELINYTNISRECHIDSKTVKEYFQILIDTLVGYYLHPYYKRSKRAVLYETPKFYLFDVGIANYIKGLTINEMKGADTGRSLEHFLFLELLAHRNYTEKDYPIHFWRTKTGLEIDFVLGEGEVIIEVKISNNISKNDLKGITAFQEEYSPRTAFIVCMEERARVIKTPYGTINIISIKEFLKDLWGQNII